MLTSHIERPRPSWIAHITLAGVLNLGFLALSSAQSPATPPSPSQQESQQAQASQADAPVTITSADVPDAEVEQFAKSLEEVLKIQAQLKEELTKSPNPEMAEMRKQEANAKIHQAIKGNGLDVDRYNVIARSTVKDAELNKRIQAKRQELQKQSADF
jgi:hypothetical protein